MLRAIPTRALALVAALVLYTAGATESLASEVSLLIPVAPTSGSKYVLLENTVRAHLGTLPVQVVMREVEHLPDGSSPWQAGRDDSEVLLVAWLSIDESTLLTVVPSHDTAPRSRPLQQGDVTWFSRCDTVAAILRSEIEPLLATADFATPTPDAVADGVPPSSEPARSELALSLGYAPSVLSTGGPVLHGLSVEVGALFVDHLAISVAVGICEGASMAPLDDRTHLNRWPLRIGVGAQMAAGPVDLRADLAVVLDIWRIAELGYTPEDASALDAQVDAAFSPAFTVRIRLLPWLAPYLIAGADLYPRSREFLLNDEVLLSRGRVVPRLGAGVAILVRPKG